MPPAPSGNPTLYNKKLIQSLLSQAGFEYTADARIPFTLHHISLEASFGRVLRKDSTDLLINFGNVYGSALEVLEKHSELTLDMLKLGLGHFDAFLYF